MQLTKEQEGLVKWGENLRTGPDPMSSGPRAEHTVHRANELAAEIRRLLNLPSLSGRQQKLVYKHLEELSALSDQWTDPSSMRV